MRHTCNHLFATKIYPMIQLGTMLIQKVALKIIIIIPLRPVHVTQRVIVGLPKRAPRLPRDLQPHFDSVHDVLPFLLFFPLLWRFHAGWSKFEYHKELTDPWLDKSEVQDRLWPLRTRRTSKARANRYQSLQAKVYAVAGSPAWASMCTATSQPPGRLARRRSSPSIAAPTSEVPFGAPAFPFMYLKWVHRHEC